MFNSQCLVSRKGALGAIWVAAYFFKKLKKSQIKDTHIPSSVDQILQKELDTLTYRVLAYLLLGVVRIYSKKVDFLLDDCNKALINVKEFVVVAKEKNTKKTNVPLSASTACFSIVLPERFELDAFDLGILEDFLGGNVKPQEDITLKDGARETDSNSFYSMERFDVEEDLFTFHETFFADYNEAKHECSANDMDVDAENVRNTNVEASDRVVEANPLESNDSSGYRQNSSRHRDDPEFYDMFGKPQMSEDIRRSQEEDTLRETICTIVQRVVDSNAACWEKMWHDESLLSKCRTPEVVHVVEEQPSGATRIDGEKENPEMSTLEESKTGSVTDSRDLPGDVEKHRGPSEAEMMDFEMFHETSKVNKSGFHNGSEKGFLSDMSFSKDASNGFNVTDTPVPVTPKAPSQLRISEGETSPLFSIIPTPAAKESSRVSRKRKCLIDDEVILPNKVIKKWLADSSILISKRRIKLFRNPSRSFFDPLIPYCSLDLRSLSCQAIKLKVAKTVGRKENSSLGSLKVPGDVLSKGQSENAQEIMETPQAAALPELKVTVGNSTEVSAEMEASSPETPANPVDIAPETPVRTSEQTENCPETSVVVSEQVMIAPETPVRESIRFFKNSETCDKETRPASPFTAFDEHQSEYCAEDRDLDAILMNEEVLTQQVNVDEREDLQQQETWSARTRNVAKFLEKMFIEKRKIEEEEEEEGKISLLKLCRGRTQKESARLFYETLVLKTKGYIEVKQEHPYGDVLITRFGRQQEAC